MHDHFCPDFLFSIRQVGSRCGRISARRVWCFRRTADCRSTLTTSGRPSSLPVLSSLNLTVILQLFGVLGANRNGPAALELALQRGLFALRQFLPGRRLFAAERSFVGRALGAAAGSLLLVEKGRDLVEVEFSRRTSACSPAFPWACRFPCGPAPWRSALRGGFGRASGVGAESGSFTLSASGVSATMASATGSGFTSCLGCASGVTSVAGASAGFVSAFFSGSFLESSSRLRQRFRRRRRRCCRFHRLRLVYRHRLLVGVDGGVAGLLGVRHDVGLLGGDRRGLLLQRRLLVALLDLADRLDRDDIDGKGLDVGHVDRRAAPTA